MGSKATYAAPSRATVSRLLYPREWPGLCPGHCNVLLEGSADAIQSALVLLKPQLREPVLRRPPDGPLGFPGGEVGALILEDVATLTANEQRSLIEWMDGRKSGMQIISTATDPLFALVVRDLFDRALYYRLNIVLLRLEASSAPRRSTRGADLARSSDREPSIMTEV